MIGNQEKKIMKKARRKATRPWKGLSIFSGIIAIILIPITIIAGMFDNTMAVFIGGTFWNLKNEDSAAQYYELDFESQEEMLEYGAEICEQVEAEGATLLMNKNNALPLEKGAAVSLFSSSAANLVYGGTGSGNVDASTAPDLRTAMSEEGFLVNDTLWDFYTQGEGKDYTRAKGGMVSLESATVAEVPWNIYTEEAKSSVTQYGDAAIVVFSRVGGEGADLSYADVNYLELDQNEIDMLSNLKKMKEAGDVKKIIVLLNTANTLEVDFLKDDLYGVDACLWIGDLGETGVNAVASILSGEVTPSGRLVDTYCYDNYTSPAMVNFTPTVYGGYEEGIIPKSASTYMIYQEGIYVGYRYYETRYEDYVMGTANVGDYKYSDEVAYPFGFGMSYTDFKYSDMSVKYNEKNDQFEVKVKVTNVGDTYSGKETVQVYSQSPYTEYDIANGVEKASATLCGFEKTDILAPGATQEVTIYVDKSELASYDSYGAETYILDEGDYYLTVAKNAHDAVNSILSAKGYTIENTDGRLDNEGNTDLVYKWNNPQFDATTYSVSENGYEIKNQLNESDLNLYSGSETKINYLSRSNWEGTFPNEIIKLNLTAQMIEDLQEIRYDSSDYEAMEMPIMNADNGKKLLDMMGLEYDDPAWEELLDQLTFDEMVSLIGDGFHWKMPVESVQSPGTRDENGPQGLTASLMKDTSIKATAFTSEDVMAATFNRDLMNEVGRIIGNNCLYAGVSSLYGTGNNMHRTPYGGRNFEYYSEDGFLSGEICAAEVAGIQEKGVDVLMKHFALNDSEQDRIGLGVWINEQAARELYLKPYQAPVEDANANGVMVAYTRFGCVWSGGNYNLITNILRNEWGCDGMIITDNVLDRYVNSPDGILAGVSVFDAMLSYSVDELKARENDPVIVNAMREAAHRNLYAIVNSSAMNGIGDDTQIKAITPYSVVIVRALLAVFMLLFIVSTVMWIIKKRDFKKNWIG